MVDFIINTLLYAACWMIGVAWACYKNRKPFPDEWWPVAIIIGAFVTTIYRFMGIV